MYYLGIDIGSTTIKFYLTNANKTGKKAFLGEAQTQKPLAVGNTMTVSFDWDGLGLIDGESTRVKLESWDAVYFVLDKPTAEKAYGEFVECIETDNQSSETNITGCPKIAN